jgi:hypothetical protein
VAKSVNISSQTWNIHRNDRLSTHMWAKPNTLSNKFGVEISVNVASISRYETGMIDRKKCPKTVKDAILLDSDMRGKRAEF